MPPTPMEAELAQSPPGVVHRRRIGEDARALCACLLSLSTFLLPHLLVCQPRPCLLPHGLCEQVASDLHNSNP